MREVDAGGVASGAPEATPPAAGRDAGTRPEHCIAPNVLSRQFEATGPNRKWAAEGWLYVAVVLDLYSRKVVGWSMSETMTAQLTIDAMLMAI